MKKFIIALGGALVVVTASSNYAFALTSSTYSAPAPADAAKINDIQGQVGNSYFQDNSLNQGASNVSKGAGSGAAGLLKNSNDQQVIVVTGPTPTADPDINNKKVPWVGLFIFLLIIIAPLVLIANMLKDLRRQSATGEAALLQDVENEEMPLEITNSEEASPIEPVEVKDEPPIEVETVEAEVNKTKHKKKTAKKHKSKKSKRKKR